MYRQLRYSKDQNKFCKFALIKPLRNEQVHKKSVFFIFQLISVVKIGQIHFIFGCTFVSEPFYRHQWHIKYLSREIERKRAPKCILIQDLFMHYSEVLCIGVSINRNNFFRNKQRKCMQTVQKFMNVY